MEKRSRVKPVFRVVAILAALAASLLLVAGVARGQEAAPAINFGKSSLAGETSNGPTSLQFGPDGRLYVAQQNGIVKAYSVGRNGPNNYQAASTETINLVNSIPNHNDDGSLNASVNTRQVTGILVAGTAQQPVLYVSSSDPRIGAGTEGTDTGLDTNSGVISRLTKTSTGWNKVDLVRGLPRSEENHSPNGMQLSPNGSTLYLALGGNTNQGAPSNNFALLPEFALSAGILEINLAAIGNTTYDLPTLNDEDRSGTNDANDPFGGNDGKNQAKLVPNGPVQIYAPGFRNAYDLVVAESGKMYTVDNGGNAGWGAIPKNAGPEGNCTNEISEPGQTNQDNFHYINAKGYYGGHPNPTRANKSNTFNASNPQSPVETANPIECDYDKPAGGSITTFPTSTNGLTEYTASTFGGAMKGDLLASGFDNKIYRLELNAAGNALEKKSEALFSSVGIIPLDVTAQGDGDIFPGTIWAADIASGNIVAFEPNESAGACDVADPNGDADGDGFANKDEQDNGTDPCSPADIPPDWDEDFISDLNDPDDDNDGIPDTGDPYPIDPDNGMTTGLPLRIDWDNESVGEGGINNTGFTGLMTDGKTDYLDLFDPDGMTVGGAGGILTIDEVDGGDALNGNKQRNAFQKGFQFGVDPTTNSRKFTVKSRIAAPFAGTTPENFQSMGMFIGTGDQDNYVKLVTSSKAGAGGIQFAKEVGGTFTSRPQPTVPMPGPDYVELYLTVDPDAGTAQPSYAVTTNGQEGQRTLMGGPEPIPAAWLDGTEALAVGIISTSFGAATTFPASWDFIEVVYGDGDSQAPEPSELAAGPQSLAFGSVEAGESATKSVSLTNTGTQEDVTISSVKVGGADAGSFVHDFGAAATLSPGESKTVGVTFSPQSGGAKSAALTVNHDGANGAIEIPLGGEGAVSPSGVLYRVNAGGAAISASEWSGDTASSPSPYVNAAETGNKTSSTGSAIDTSGSSIPQGTPEAVFKSERWDAKPAPNMNWAFPVEPGAYEVRLYFAETFAQIDAPGKRVFDVSAEGGVVLDNYDVFAESGGLNKGVVESFTVQSDDSLNVSFAHAVQNPALKGIEVLAEASQPPPVESTSASSFSIGSAGSGINASTYGNGSFKITNNSPDGQKIEDFRIDLSTAILPDMVFDPVGKAGDKVAKCFQADAGASAVGLVAPAKPCVDPFRQPHAEGYDALELSFTDFGPGETFTFSADVDPTSIKGSTAPGPNESGSASGLELAGSEMTFGFDDGSVRESQPHRIPNSLGGSQGAAKPDLPAKPSIQALGVQSPATVSGASQTVRVSGPAGSSVSLMVLEAGLFTAGLPNGGYEIEPFEANSALAVAEKTAQIGAGGTVDIPVTLTRSHESGGLNYMAAVVKGAGGQTGPLSNVAILEYDPQQQANQPPTLGAIGSQSVEEGGKKTIQVAATDPDGDPVTLSAASLPGFAAFTDNGGGSGSLALSPQPGDAGEYQITATASDGSASDSETFALIVAAAPSSNYSIKFSKQNDRSSPAALDGATVAGKIHAFTAPDTSVKQVAFYLDDPDMSGAPHRVEKAAPYDFAGGAVATSNAFFTQTIADGPHTITAKLTLTNGTTEVAGADFAVANSSAGVQSTSVLSASSESIEFEDVEVGQTEERRTLLTNTSDSDVRILTAGMGGPDAGRFSLRAVDPTTLAPGEAVPVEVSFEPRGGGRSSATLTVAHDRSQEPVAVDVVGTGVGAAAPPPDTTKPRILGFAPRPGATVVARKPVIRTNVRDAGGALRKANIKFFVDGRPTARFAYNPRNGSLVHRPPRDLSIGRHVVRVVATDAAGNRAVKAWGFRVSPRG